MTLLLIITCVFCFSACGSEEEKINLIDYRSKNVNYLRVDGEGNENSNGDYILFGYYPQSRLTDATVTEALNKKYKFSESSGKWLYQTYDFVNHKDTTTNETTLSAWNLIYYRDVTYKGVMYRGVNIINYRPLYADDNLSKTNGMQYKEEFEKGKVYWFKYEPIMWQITENENGKALLTSNIIIDAQPYQGNIENIDDKYYVCDSYFDEGTMETYTYIDGMPENTYANNYRYSYIRKWLAESFYNNENVFNEAEKNLIQKTSVNNTDSGYSDYLSENTEDYVFILSQKEIYQSLNIKKEKLYKKATDYSLVQGCYRITGGTYAGNGWYWTRSPIDKESFTMVDSEKGEVSTHGSYYSSIIDIDGSEKYSSVTATSGGIVPSLYIAL